MLDRLAILAPSWQERHPADLGVGAVEALAYVADHLSYRQDAIATEAYLGTARLRTSVRRHARLVDYFIGEGSSARVWLRIGVNKDIPLGIPQGTRFATAFGSASPPLLEGSSAAYTEAVTAGAMFWETMQESVPLLVEHREMPLYNWSDRRACLAPGATRATLAGTFPGLQRGMVLVLAEISGTLTGAAADADPNKRQPVRLIQNAVTGTDPVTGAFVTEIEWHSDDALRFPLCVASVTDAAHGEQPIVGVSAAWGNMVLADQGRSVGVASDPLSTTPEDIGHVSVDIGRRFRPRLASGPVTFAAANPLAHDQPATTQSIHSAASVTHFDAAKTTPAVSVRSVDADGNVQVWRAVADLLAVDIDPLTAAFVVEVESDGSAYLRFGDGVNGVKPSPASAFTATYRLGNGAQGNVARESILLIDATDLPPATRNAITAVSNPLPAFGGVDPESIEHVRQSAPVAFRSQKRAVTASDYASVALQFPGVRRAAATLRWTGSWYTVFLTVERTAGAPLDPQFIRRLEAFVDGYRLAGFDLEVEDALRTPLLIEMHVCVKQGYVALDVERALRAIFSGGVLRDGTLGVFNSERLDLGQPVYLSPLYARAQAVDGVESVSIVRFERQAAPSDIGLRTGVLLPDPLELFVLEDDANFPERGQFELVVEGGL